MAVRQSDVRVFRRDAPPRACGRTRRAVRSHFPRRAARATHARPVQLLPVAAAGKPVEVRVSFPGAGRHERLRVTLRLTKLAGPPPETAPPGSPR